MLKNSDDLLSLAIAIYAPEKPPRDFCRLAALKDVKSGISLENAAREWGLNSRILKGLLKHPDPLGISRIKSSGIFLTIPNLLPFAVLWMGLFQRSNWLSGGFFPLEERISFYGKSSLKESSRSGFVRLPAIIGGRKWICIFQFLRISPDLKIFSRSCNITGFRD
ncbi:MAG: hypothetical protein HY717_22395 [Planctomycetes bacterium]|nr:hypothetical protein [Planctomycetota bacterium]